MTATKRVGPRALTQFLAVLGLVAVLAAGCGTGDTAGPAPGGPNDLKSAATTPNLVKQTTSAPKPGGKLVFGLEAETDGWDPTSSRWANSAYEVAYAIFDPLVVVDKDFKATPYLAESLTPTADFKTWDIKLRPNIKFHDGSALDSAALLKFFEAQKASLLVGQAMRAVDSYEIVDPLTVRVRMNQSWATYPYHLTLQAGAVAAPKQLDADKEAKLRQPIGTGPFVFNSWNPDKNLLVKKNPNYWRKSEGLPYLDEVDFRPISNTDSRYAALKAGDIDVMITSRESTIDKLLGDAKAGAIQANGSQGDNDASLLLINTTKAPLDDIRVRQALAYGVDRTNLALITETDPSLEADGIYAKTSPWYKDTGYPKYDLAKAKQLIAAYQAEKGPVRIPIGATVDPEVQKLAQTVAAQWSELGIQVDIQTKEQATYITDAVLGNYTAQIWRQFGTADPDQNYVWFHGDNAAGSITLNMARNKDPLLDQALVSGRATQDKAARKAAYDKVQERLTADLQYIFFFRIRWTMGASNKVRGIEHLSLPGGGQSSGLVNGVFPVAGMWLEP